MSAPDDTPDTAVLNAVTVPAAADQPVHDPDRKAVTCGGCGEQFARAAFGGRALFLAETLRAGALAAGWEQDGDAWTCTVCLARVNAEPEPGPAATPEPGPAADDPIAVSAAILAAYDERIDVFWTDVNRSNSEADLRVRMRLADAQPAVVS